MSRAGRLIWAGLVGLSLLIGLELLQPPPLKRLSHWAAYRLGGSLPDPIVAGQNGRLFLGHHEGSPPGSLIRSVCGDGVPGAQVAAAEAAMRPVLAAGSHSGLPFRVLIVPTAPRLYPEDLPENLNCSDPPADRLVAALDDPHIVYPVDQMLGWKTRFDVIPRRHFHWAGEAPLRTAELVGASLGFRQEITIPVKADNRASDLNGFDAGLDLDDAIMEADLKRAGISICSGARCSPAVPQAVVAFERPGPGRLLVIADSFGDEIGGPFSEFAGLVWLVQMNVALLHPPTIKGFRPDAIIVVYHDAGALALDGASQASLALAAKLVREASLPSSTVIP